MAFPLVVLLPAAAASLIIGGLPPPDTGVTLRETGLQRGD